MAAENFKVKKGLEVGTGITANSDGVNVTGIITATQFKGDGSGLTGVVGSGSGIVVKDEGSAVGTAGTVNFVGSGVAATLSAGTATVTINAGDLDNVVEDTTPQLGGNLDLNSKFVTGSGGINVTGVVTATTLKGNGDFVDIDVDGQTELDELNVAGVSTFTSIINANQGILLTDSDNKSILLGESDDMRIRHTGSHSEITDEGQGSLRLGGNNIVIGSATFGATMATFAQGGSVKLYHNNQQKLTTTINGIEVPDLNVTGVGTVGRLDTNGVTLGTNNNTFAAKFIDDAVANFGTDNDLKISHDDTHARITNTKGNIVVSGIISATSDVKVGSAITMDPTSGIITATSFSGSGSGLTSIPSAQLSGALPALDGSALTGITASGSGIIIKHDGSTVGTAGTINFSTNLDVTPISAGIVTITASGGSATTINNNADNRLITGSGTANTLEAESGLTYDGTYLNHIGSGFKQLKIDTSTGNSASLLLKNSSGNFTINTISNAGNRNFTIYDGTAASTRFSINQNGTVGITSGLNVTGVATATTFSGSGASLTNLPAANLTGTIAAISGANLTNLPAANLTGTIAAISGANLTSLNADELDSGTIPNGRFPATLPAASGANLTSLTAGNISGTIASGQIADEAVTFAKMQHVGTGVFIGRNDSGSGDIETLTAAEARTLLNVADGATAGITTAPSNVVLTWDVVNQGASAYRFTGPGQDPTANNPDIYLVRGNKYRFALNASGHPFQIRVSNGGSSYDDGVTSNGAQTGNVEFYVQNDAPASLVYQCTQHPGMVGNIYITGHQLTNGVNNRILTATSAYGMNGEANLTFDGSTLSSAGNINCTSGRFQRGSATVQDGDAIAGGININGTDMDASVIMSVFGNDGDFTRISGSKSRNASVGGHTIVQDNDVLLSLRGFGSDGTNFEEAAQIEMQVDGTPANNVMPGRIVFKTTTTDGVAERARIHSNGQLELKVPDANPALKITPSGTNAPAAIDFNTPGIGPAVFKVQGSEKLRIDSSGHLKLPNNAFIRLGDAQTSSGTLRIYSNGTQSYISPGVTGNHIRFLNSGSTSQVELYFGTAQKLSTQSYGILVQGKVSGTSALSTNDAGEITIGTRSRISAASGTCFVLENSNSGGDERLRISSEGYITAPNNVAFSANGGPSDVTSNVIIFGTSLFQRGGTNYSTSTGIFTAPVDGIYHFMCNPYRYTDSNDSALLLETSTNGGTTWTTQIEIRNMNNYLTDSGRGWFTLSLSQLMDLNANDQVRVKAVGRVHCNGTFSRFSGFLVA